jgi:Ca2+-binding RTX toxin-like protein
MRRMTTMVLTVAVLMVALSGVAFATSEPICRFVGTSGNDSIRGTAGDDVLEGRSGDDALYCMGGHDFLYDQYGHDGLYGGPGDDVIHGGKGDNRTEERAVHGGSGQDVLYGEGGADALYGGPGNDIVLSTYDDAGDYVDCGGGVDTVQKAGAPDLNLDRFVNCVRFEK